MADSVTRIEIEPGRATDDPQRAAPDRVDLVRRAVAQWRRQLIDTSGNNRLLSYRDMAVGTLNLTPRGDSRARAAGVDALLRGGPVNLSEIYPAGPAFADAHRRLSNIAQKAGIVREEKGLDSLFVALGLARWRPPDRGRPNAPVLLVPVTVKPVGGAEEDFAITRSGEAMLNPVLGLVLRVEYRILGLEALVEAHLASEELSVSSASTVLREIEARCADLPKFTVAPRAVMGNFSYSAMPMVIDLEGNVDQLARSDLVAALAGVPTARQAVAASRVRVNHTELDRLDPADEVLVMDADSTQLEAIRRVLQGESMVIQGPPGTGKSQTIVNMIAALVEAGKRVLFVAEKRVAIESVHDRLHQLGLDGLVLDFRGGVGARQRIADVIGTSLQPSANGRAAPAEGPAPELAEIRASLREHVDELHRPIQPAGLSRYEIYRALLAGGVVRPDVAMTAGAAEGLTADAVDGLAGAVAEWVELGGPSFVEEYPEWTFLLQLAPERIEGIRYAIDELGSRYLPAALAAVRAAADDVKLEHPSTLDGWSELIALFEDVARFADHYDPAIYKENLEATVLDLAPADEGPIARLRAKMLSPRYRGAVQSVRGAAGRNRRGDELLEAASLAIEHKRQWVMRRRDGRLPRPPHGLTEAVQALAALRARIADLADIFDVTPWLQGPVGDLEKTVERLGADPVFENVARIARLHQELSDAGLEALLAAVADGDIADHAIAGAVRSAWLGGLLALARRRAGAPFDGSRQDRLQREFRRLDRHHIEQARRTVLESVAARASEAIGRHPDEVEFLREELAKNQGFVAPRGLVERAADVLGALRPCWMMSPLLVSEILPPRPGMFDVVIFDEASQVIPAEAIPSLARVGQMVVVGDRRQLPPTTFFTKTVMDEEADDDADDAPQFESILEASSDVVSELLLNRHYRSRDERLIAFSNAEIYRGALRTFPGPGGPSPIRHRLVPSPAVAADGTRSNPDEVEVVVDLVLDHAQNRPDLSLGVITMGQAHAHNIEQALRRRLGALASPVLDAWFGARPVEPFFVKNLERVQGDERDIVILTTGYHKTPEGELPQQTFGPLLRSGGERRLNVAITRSRVALEVVTSFAAADMRSERSDDAPAVDLLRRFLTSLEAEEPGPPDPTPVDAVVADIGRYLEQAGVPVVTGFGRSGYRIGIAARHPDDLDRFVLAIEIDDETYLAEPTVRDRDRVVTETLERLGWRVHRIWVDDWMRDPRGETRRAVESWVEAVIASDQAQPRVEDGV